MGEAHRQGVGVGVTALTLEWRAMRPDDRHYVISSWVRSYHESSEFSRLERGVYFELYEPVVRRLVDSCTVLVAGDPEIPDAVLGYVVTQGDAVHYVLTKPAFRKMGVATWMMRELRALPATYTAAPGRVALKLLGAQWRYDPMARFKRKAAA